MSGRQSLSRRAKVKAKPGQAVDISDDEIVEPPAPPQDFVDAALMEEDDSQAFSSDGSEYGNGRGSKKRRLPNMPRAVPKPKRPKKLQVSKKARVSIPPAVPDMSDDDDRFEEPETREDEVSLFSERRLKIKPTPVKATLMSRTLRIEVKSAPAIIHINLGDLLSEHLPAAVSPAPSQQMDFDLDGDTLLDSNKQQLKRKRIDCNRKENLDDYFQDMRLNKKYASFLELEPQLRNRIYREMLTSDAPIQFGTYSSGATGMPTQAPLLRTCRQVCDEASSILYGENAFHFNRKSKDRGRYWDKEWTEIGYKDIRRFLEHIGPSNIAKMRYLSILFDDATPSSTPRLEAPERKFVNDPVVLHLLRLIGNSGAVLEKFVVAFSSRSQLSLEDVHFLRALTTIKCQNLINTCTWGHSKIQPRLFDRIKSFMEISEDTTIDRHRRKIPLMQHEGPGRSFCWDRFCTWRSRHSSETSFY